MDCRKLSASLVVALGLTLGPTPSSAWVAETFAVTSAVLGVVGQITSGKAAKASASARQREMEALLLRLGAIENDLSVIIEQLDAISTKLSAVPQEVVYLQNVAELVQVVEIVTSDYEIIRNENSTQNAKLEANQRLSQNFGALRGISFYFFSEAQKGLTTAVAHLAVAQEGVELSQQAQVLFQAENQTMAEKIDVLFSKYNLEDCAEFEIDALTGTVEERCNASDLGLNADEVGQSYSPLVSYLDQQKLRWELLQSNSTGFGSRFGDKTNDVNLGLLSIGLNRFIQDRRGAASSGSAEMANRLMFAVDGQERRTTDSHISRGCVAIVEYESIDHDGNSGSRQLRDYTIFLPALVEFNSVLLSKTVGEGEGPILIEVGNYLIFEGVLSPIILPTDALGNVWAIERIYDIEETIGVVHPFRPSGAEPHCYELNVDRFDDNTRDDILDLQTFLQENYSENDVHFHLEQEIERRVSEDWMSFFGSTDSIPISRDSALSFNSTIIDAVRNDRLFEVVGEEYSLDILNLISLGSALLGSEEMGLETGATIDRLSGL